MTASFDQVTASLLIDISDSEFAEFRADLERNSPSPRSRRLAAILGHEKAHFFSFFGSALADFHRMMAQVQVTQFNLLAAHVAPQPRRINLPLYPRGGEAPQTSEEALPLHIANDLNRLRDLYFGVIGPVAPEQLALAQHITHSFAHSADVIQSAEWEVPDLPSLFIDEGMAEEIHEAIGRPVLGREGQLIDMPSIPRGAEFGFSDEPLFSSSVWEASALMSEILSSNHESCGTGIRASIPKIYQTGLRYALHALNVATDQNYEYGELIANKLPLPFTLTIAGMVELALHPTDPFSTQHKGGKPVVAMCPAWRLFFIANKMMQKRLLPLEDVTSENPNGDYHDWQDYIGRHFGWASWELPGIVASMGFRQSKGQDPYDDLCSMGKILRVRDCLRYIQQISYPRDGEWFDYLTIRLTDRIYMPNGSQEHAYYARDWADAFYGRAALCTGDHWDFWLGEYHGSRSADVARRASAYEFARINQMEGRISDDGFDTACAHYADRIDVNPSFAS